MKGKPYLELLNGPYAGKEVTVSSSVFLVGRNPDCDFQVKEITLSGYHCCIYGRTDGSWFIKDLESSNGVRVNQVRVKDQIDLHDADQIRIADFKMVFRLPTQAGQIHYPQPPESATVTVGDTKHVTNPQCPSSTAEEDIIPVKSVELQNCDPQDHFYFGMIGLMVGFCFGFFPVLATARVMDFNSGYLPHFNGAITAVFGACWVRSFHKRELIVNGKRKYDLYVMLFYIIVIVVILLSFATIVKFPEK